MSFEDLAVVCTETLLPFTGSTSSLQTPPDFLDKLPVAIYACDAEGRILWFNQLAAALWGRMPRIGEDGDRFCGSFKAYVGDRLIARNELPMATVLRTGRRVRGFEGRLEQPDGTFVWVSLHIDPMEDDAGTRVGAICCFHEMPSPRRADTTFYEQERLAQTFEHAGIGIVEVDAEGRLLRVNSRLADLMGYAPEELLGKVIFAESHEADAEADRAQFRRQVAGEIDRYTIEKRIKTKAGGYFWASVTSSSVCDADGQFLYAVRVEHDITERKRGEQAAQRLAAIVESSADAIISKDLNGIMTSWNRGAEHLFGYTAEEAVGRPVTILIPADLLDEEPDILSRVRRGERIEHCQTVRQRKDGTTVNISLTVSPIRDGQGRIVGASKIVRDITEQKEAEAKLRESERRLQELLAAIPAAIYTTDAEGKVTYFNEAAVDLAGRTPTIGSDEWCVTWKLYRPDGSPLPHDECPMALALKEERPIRNTEVIAERPDGVCIPVIPYPTPLRDAEGNVVGAINMLVDVSERKQAETQQRILLNELNHRVKNNMQMLQSLLHTASRQTENGEARRVLSEASGRIAAMAAAQRILYGTTEATRFNAQDFLNSVCDSVRQTYSTEAKITCEAGAIELSNDVSMPLALILNELLTNALKYGANADGEVNIRIGLTKEVEFVSALCRG